MFRIAELVTTGPVDCWVEISRWLWSLRPIGLNSKPVELSWVESGRALWLGLKNHNNSMYSSHVCVVEHIMATPMLWRFFVVVFAVHKWSDLVIIFLFNDLTDITNLRWWCYLTVCVRLVVRHDMTRLVADLLRHLDNMSRWSRSHNFPLMSASSAHSSETLP